MLFKAKKPSSEFKGVNKGLGTISNSTGQHFSPVIGQWKPDVGWETLGPFPQSHHHVFLGLCLASDRHQCLVSASPSVFKDEGEYRQKGKVVCPSQQADILCGSWTVSNVMHCLEGSLLSVFLWGKNWLSTLFAVKPVWKVRNKSQCTILTPRAALCPWREPSPSISDAHSWTEAIKGLHGGRESTCHFRFLNFQVLHFF